MKTINIDGVEYVEKTEAAIGFQKSEHVAVICDRGWIFEGYKQEDEHDGTMRLSNASVVRRWDNGLGIGGLAKAEHKDEYTLDAVGSIALYNRSIIGEIQLEW